MKAFSLPPIRSLNGTQLWLLGIAASLVTVHLTLVGRHVERSFFMLSVLFWTAAASLVWQKRDRLRLNSGLLPSLLGLLLLVLVLHNSVVTPSENLLNISPFISALGLGLIASGFKGLKQYWRELTILFFLGVPKVICEPLDISYFTAKFSAMLLWYMGVDVYRQGVELIMPNGAVSISSGCSGFNNIFYLLGLSVLALLMYPISGRKKIAVPLVAIVLAFVANGLRVILLALIANTHRQPGFDYWHTGAGSQIFSLISVMLFGTFYFFLLQKEVAIEQSNAESKKS